MKKLKSWNPIWEEIFIKQEWGKYPPEELVRFIARNFYHIEERKKIKILDLGCGTGASSWFLAKEGFSVYGMDGSKTAIKKANERFKEECLEGNFKVGDFIRLDYPNNFFDCVIDVCSIQHNRITNVSTIFNEVFRVTKKGGKIFSMMISRESKLNHFSNPFKGRGFVYFFTRKEIESLFKSFIKLVIEKSERTDRGNLISHFVISAEKP